MILESLKIENFRCFQSLSVDFHKQLNVFVGGNGTGKTTLLSAIANALAPIILRLPLENRRSLPRLLSQDIRSTGADSSAPYASITTRAIVKGQERVTWDRTRFRDSSSLTKSQAPRGRKDSKELYKYLDSITDSHNLGKPYILPMFAYYSTNRAVDVPHNRMQNRALQKTFVRMAGLENALESKTDFRRAVVWYDLLEQRELREQRDKRPSEATLAIKAVRQAIESMVPQITNPRIDSKTGRFAVDSYDHEGNSIRLHLDQLSDGYQAMLGVAMDFALRLVLANPPNSSHEDVLASEAIMIIDEVDLHLHPVWQQKVIPDLLRTFKRTQFILTTHSPQVATTVPSECLRILKNASIYSAPAGTEGAEAERLLQDVFQVNPRPNLPITNKLKRYLSLVDQRRWDSEEAIALRKELDEWSRGEEPMLVEADLRIDNMKWEEGE